MKTQRDFWGYSSMKDFLLIKNLVGEDLQQEELKNVDCYVHDKFGLFIPSTGTCGYAQRRNF